MSPSICHHGKDIIYYLPRFGFGMITYLLLMRIHKNGRESDTLYQAVRSKPLLLTESLMKTHSAITRGLTVGFQYQHRCTNTFKYEFSYQHFRVWVTGKAIKPVRQV